VLLIILNTDRGVDIFSEYFRTGGRFICPVEPKTISLYRTDEPSPCPALSCISGCYWYGCCYSTSALALALTGVLQPDSATKITTTIGKQ